MNRGFLNVAVKAIATLAFALALWAVWGYTPPVHNSSYTTNGITYAQRGGLGAADYVVTNIDASAVGRVRSVNGMVGDVVIDAEGVGAVARDADYLAVSNAAMGAVQEEVDPSVPAWAKGDTPPLPPDYAAVASNAAVAVKTETDPTVPAWAKGETPPLPPNYTTVTNKAIDAVQKTGDTMSGNLRFVGEGGQFIGVEVEYHGVDDVSTVYAGNSIFHATDSESEYLYWFPNETGTLALTSDIPTTMPWGSITGKPDIPTMGNISNVADSAAGLAYTNANAYTDASISETNDAFVAAVQAASPPVVLPDKWALANVTNANGGAVSAVDVGALSSYCITNGSGVYRTVKSLYTTNDAASYPVIVSELDEGTVYRTMQNPHGIEQNMLMEGMVVAKSKISLDPIDNGFSVITEDMNGIRAYAVLPYDAQGYFAIESWASLSRTLENTASNSSCKAACADALEKITESKPHFAIIDGEVHIISITP